MIVIASIHQPNYELLQLFDNLLLLANGRMVYSDRTGPSILASAIESYSRSTDKLPDYLASLGYPVPGESSRLVSPSETTTPPPRTYKSYVSHHLRFAKLRV